MKALRIVFISLLIIHLIEIILLALYIDHFNKEIADTTGTILIYSFPIDAVLSFFSFIWGGIFYFRSREKEMLPVKKKRGLLIIGIFHLAGTIVAILMAFLILMLYAVGTGMSGGSF